MSNNWLTCSSDIRDFVYLLLNETNKILREEFVGFYLHGSLAMGGFNPHRSDIDILIVTKNVMTVENKRGLAKLFLTYSNQPFPVEISILNEGQLKHWEHPSPFEFHFSECWREQYEYDLDMKTYHYLNKEISRDLDLAAHITIIVNRGLCIEGKALAEVFPLIPQAHYLSSIMGDYEECIKNIEKNPIYCTLNLLRVFCYLKEGVISSKEEAGKWGLSSLPIELHSTIQKVLDGYLSDVHFEFEKSELFLIRNIISRKVLMLLQERNYPRNEGEILS